jgi:general secretion pathway protein K
MPLLYVLWTVALLTVIATAMSASGGVSYHMAHNAAEQARHEALAEAALNRAVLALLDRRQGQGWRVDGVPQAFAFEGTQISVAIQDELARIDINQADAPLLAGIFRAVGQSDEQADTIVDRIIDWRDPDDLRRLHGAEAGEYTVARFTNRPRNAPFQSVEELTLLLGMTPELFRRAQPFLTVFSNRSAVDPRFAPREVLLALSGGAGATLPTGAGSRDAGVLDLQMPLEGRAFLIRIDFAVGQAQISREAVIRITGDEKMPYWLLSWHR